MLGAHSQVHAPAEPHLLTPLAHLGYYARAELSALDASGASQRRRARSRYALERKLLVALRRNIHQNAFGRLVRRIRASDVLLR